MMKFILFSIGMVLSMSAMSGTLCLSSAELNQARTLYEPADFLFMNGSDVASERLCSDQRSRYFARCIDDEINLHAGTRFKVCPESEPATSEIIQNTREQCGNQTFEKRLPDCGGDQYVFPTCQQFAGFQDGNEKNRCLMQDIAPDIGVLQPVSVEMNREERSRKVLFQIRDNLVHKFEKGLEPLTAFRKCLEAKHAGEKLEKVSFGGQEVECQKIVDLLMAKVIMNLPVLRQHQILSHTPALTSRGADDLTFRRQFKRDYPNANLSREELRELGSAVSLEKEELPVGDSPDPTLSELQDAAEIRREQFRYRDQQFLEAYEDKEPFSNCVVSKGRGENRRLEFISMTQDSRRALSCGITTIRDETRITGSITTRQDELNMSDADQHEALQAFLSYRTEIVLDHKQAVKSMI